MTDEQPKLLNGPDKKSLGGPASRQGGPVFEPGPGWGFYIKRWFRKYFFRVILPITVIIAVVGIFATHKTTENSKETKEVNKITIVIVRGDSQTLLARKVLANYLSEHPDEDSLSSGQKIFIEEKLRRGMGNQKLTVGKIVEFTVDDIKTAIAQAKQLTQFQLQKWEEYAEKVRF